MTSIPLGKGDWLRDVADEAAIPVLNRYYEQNPTNLVEGSALISRPALKRAVTVGSGPIRSLYSQPGSFGDALFTVSYDELYKVAPDKTVTLISGGLFGTSLTSSPSMAATGRLGTTPEYLFIADGRDLFVYSENSQAAAQLAVTGLLAAGYTLHIGNMYYSLTSGSVNAGAPAGTLANPWLILLKPAAADTLAAIVLALNGTGIAGTDYSTALTSNPLVTGTLFSPTVLNVLARDAGTAGNTIPTVATGANWAFGTATLTLGGTTTFRQVPTPDDVGVKSVCFLLGFIVVVIAQGYGQNGRFYWIEPGETTIDPLNFATAERLPDGVLSCRAVGDQLWLFGTDTTEIWYITGDPIALFQRVQGRLFDHGVWEGTDCQIGDSLFVVDAEGVVYSLTGGGPERISDHSIEERIREAMVLSKQRDFDITPP
jgi:hypothetical protein